MTKKSIKDIIKHEISEIEVQLAYYKGYFEVLNSVKIKDKLEYDNKMRLQSNLLAQLQILLKVQQKAQ